MVMPGRALLLSNVGVHCFMLIIILNFLIFIENIQTIINDILPTVREILKLLYNWFAIVDNSLFLSKLYLKMSEQICGIIWHFGSCGEKVGNLDFNIFIFLLAHLSRMLKKMSL